MKKYVLPTYSSLEFLKGKWLINYTAAPTPRAHYGGGMWWHPPCICSEQQAHRSRNTLVSSRNARSLQPPALVSQCQLESHRRGGDRPPPPELLKSHKDGAAPFPKRALEPRLPAACAPGRPASGQLLTYSPRSPRGDCSRQNLGLGDRATPGLHCVLCCNFYLFGAGAAGRSISSL